MGGRVGRRGLGVILLCFAAGATDALSYLTLGHVFTSSMTGCAALFCLALASGKTATALRAGLAMGSYLLGCALAGMLPSRPVQPGPRRQVGHLLCVEILLLLAYAFCAAPPAGPVRAGLLIVFSATAMGVQSVVARDLGEPGISTVALNPTMTSLGLAFPHLARGREPGETRLQGLVLLAYAGGAVLTALGARGHAAAMSALPLAAAGAALLLILAPRHYAKA